MSTSTLTSNQHTYETRKLVPPRRIYNPVQKDFATFLETSAETKGVRTLLEIELAPGGGNLAHYHKAFSERFEVLEGELQVQVGEEKRLLKPGQSALALPETLHCFSNPSAQPTRFLVELTPGHTGFEQALCIAYGLAADGKTNEQSLPTNLYHLAVLITLGESKVPGAFGLLMPVIHYLAGRARKKGIEQALIEKYC